ncbi:MAG: sulfotransferase, partial [Paracoccaceae bacterium]|nr:sulfotransferase [Paracoccaceae bacterium]
GDGTRIAQRLMFEGPGGVQSMASLAPSAIAGLGHEYATMMRARFGDASHVTDKSIQTYLFLGLMKLALPKARFVVVRRDPRDTLLSIYKNKFPDGTHLYGYDQRDLAKYYTSFVQMIDFWRAMVPDWFYEVQYEALVANPEVESRKLIAACGLEWQDSCLNFHQNTRKVETLSVFQVRQPISGGSVKSWQRYEAELAPMLQALAEDGHVLD